MGRFETFLTFSRHPSSNCCPFDQLYWNTSLKHDPLSRERSAMLVAAISAAVLPCVPLRTSIIRLAALRSSVDFAVHIVTSRVRSQDRTESLREYVASRHSYFQGRRSGDSPGLFQRPVASVVVVQCSCTPPVPRNEELQTTVLDGTSLCVWFRLNERLHMNVSEVSSSCSAVPVQMALRLCNRD